MISSFRPWPSYSLQADCTLQAQGVALASCTSPRRAGDRKDSMERSAAVQAPTRVTLASASPRNNPYIPPVHAQQELRHWSKHELFFHAMSSSSQPSGRTLWTTLKGPHNNPTGLVGPHAQSCEAEPHSVQQHKLQESEPSTSRSQHSHCAVEKLPLQAKWGQPSGNHKLQPILCERQKLDRDFLLQGKSKVPSLLNQDLLAVRVDNSGHKLSDGICFCLNLHGMAPIAPVSLVLRCLVLWDS